MTTYFGEVYPSWYWGIKQQAIKEFLQKIKKDSSKKFKEFKNKKEMRRTMNFQKREENNERLEKL